MCPVLRGLRDFEKYIPLGRSGLQHGMYLWFLKSFTWSPYEALHLSSDRDLTLKKCVLLALVTARVGELHGLSCEVQYLKRLEILYF